MPTVSSSSVVRTSTDHFSLALRARHVLVAGTASENVRTIKGRLPEDVDVILDSDLVIALSGTVNTVEIPGHVIERSAVARHILDYLRANAGQLGLSTISNLYVDEDESRAKCMRGARAPVTTAKIHHSTVSLSSSRPLRAATEMACLRLVSIDVVLACRMIVRGGKDCEVMLGLVTNMRAKLRSTGSGFPFLWSGVPPSLLGAGRHFGKIRLKRPRQAIPSDFWPLARET